MFSRIILFAEKKFIINFLLVHGGWGPALSHPLRGAKRRFTNLKGPIKAYISFKG